MLRPRVRRWWVVWTALAAAVNCSESPFEPRGEGERVPIGLVIEDQVSGDTVNWYSFAAAPNQLFAVFLDASQGHVQLAVYDSTHQALVATLSAGPTTPALDENPSNRFGTATGAVYRLRLNSLPPGSTARFRFKVYGIDLAPERVPGSFTLGDTVTGETIDPIVDVDQFRAHGDGGQEIVAVVETQGPAGSGSVALDVVDTATNNLLGYVFADASTSNPLTTGRMRLSGTHDYLFTLGSVTSYQYPLYRGPYRFWTYVIDRAPEHRARAIPFNTEIGNERIDRAGDVDEFTFQAAGGDYYNTFVQGGGRTFQLEVAPQGGTTFAIATSQGSDTALFAHATGRFQIANAGTYVVRVTGTTPHQVADTGAYRVYLYAIDRRPEHVPATVTPGDTVTGEDIELPGDIDEFTFSGTAGEEFNVAVRAQNGSPDTRLQLEVLTGSGTVLRSAQSVGTDTSLLRQVTGQFALPGTGTYRLRVTGSPDYGDPYQYRGPYRLFLYRIDRRPETLPDSLAFGDSLSGERIDLPGDVDEFRVTVPDTSGANLVVEFEEQPAAGTWFTAQLIDAATGRLAAAPLTSQAGVRVASGRLRLAPGHYIVRVDVGQYEDRPVLRGPYRLWLYRFGFGPEAVSDTFAVGDTVSGESIEPWGDADQLHFYGVRGQHVNVLLQGLAPPTGGGFEIWITLPGAPPTSPVIFVSSPTASASLEEHQTTRLELPATGWYGLEVHGANWNGGAYEERGAYRFAVIPIGNTAPEHVSAALAPGDSVTTEPIDTLGDWDEFTVTAAPGQEMSVVFDGRDGFTGPFAYVWVFDPATLDTLAFQPGQFRRIAGPFRAPPSGRFKIAVFEPAGFFRICYDATCGGIYRFVGPYGFHVIAVNRAPEKVAASYTVGDTVRGETISPVGDIDEFTSSGTPGEQLTLFDRLTATSSLDSAIVLEVIDPATGTSLVGSNVAIFGSSTFFPVGSFTVPASGTFIVRAHVYGEWGYGAGETSYEFFVKR
ncbi:MAG TPA: hypothetical protein VIW28_13115 [Gemmatimonadales bacterium]